MAQGPEPRMRQAILPALLRYLDSSHTTLYTPIFFHPTSIRSLCPRADTLRSESSGRHRLVHVQGPPFNRIRTDNSAKWERTPKISPMPGSRVSITVCNPVPGLCMHPQAYENCDPHQLLTLFATWNRLKSTTPLALLAETETPPSDPI